MKKYLLSMLLTLLIPLGAVAQEAYAVLDGSTLTFYYDNQRSTRSGTKYDLNIGSNNPGWYRNIKSITIVMFDSSFSNARPTSTYYWFCGATGLIEIEGIEYLNTSSVTTMRAMFTNCSKLTTLDVSGFNTGNVTDMSYMFQDCSRLTTLDVNEFDTGNVTSMSSMFKDCSRLTTLDVSGFDTGNVTDMGTMFYGCNSLTSLDVSGFDTGKVTNMHNMFDCCNSLTNLDVSGFNTGNVTNMGAMFYGCNSLTSLDVSGFDTGNVTDMSHMFNGCSSLTSLNVSGFDTGNVTGMWFMFENCSSLKEIDLSGFDTGNVTNMHGMFYNCSSFTTLDLSKFDTGNVTDMTELFYGCSGLTSIDVSSFNTSKVTSMGYMFYDCNSLMSLDVSGFDTGNVTDMTDLFYGCSGLTSIDVSSFNTSKVTSMGYMFYDCNSLMSLDVSGFDTGNVTNMQGMFQDCSSLATLDLSRFNTGNLTGMNSMFGNCSSLTTLDLSGFNTAKVKYMSYMFNGCSSLTTIYCGNDWSINDGTTADYMFTDCTSLVGGEGTVYNSSQTGKAYAHADGGTSNPGYLTLKDASAAEIPVDEEHFPDESFRQWIVDNVSGGDDSKLSEAEIAAIKTLDISGHNITDLTGIEYFTELTELRVHNNKLTRLDVSKNTKLIRLYAHDNELTEINVTKNIYLEELYVYNNKLTTIDVTKNTLLRILHIYNNVITNINLTYNVELTELYIYKNKLTVIDLTKNVKLIRLHIYNNELTIINLQYNVLLEELYIYNNKLTVIDLTKNVKLIRLHIYNNELTEINLTYNVLLEELYIYNNKLTVIDLTKNVKLVRLHIYNNELLWIRLTENTLIEEVEVSSQTMTRVVVNLGLHRYALVVPAGIDVTKITSLTVNGITITSENFYIDAEGRLVIVSTVKPTEIIYHYVTGYSTVKMRVVVNTTVSTTGIEVDEVNFPDAKLREWIIVNLPGGEDGLLTDEEIALIKTIDISGLNITNLKGIELFTELEELYAYNNKITTVDLTKNVKLRIVHLYNNELTEINLTYNVLLEELYIYNNKLTVIDLTKNVKLLIVHLYGNELTWLNLTGNVLITEGSLSSQSTSRTVYRKSSTQYGILVDGGFDLSKVSGLTVGGVETSAGGTSISDGYWIIPGVDGASSISYDYDTGNGNSTAKKMRVNVNLNNGGGMAMNTDDNSGMLENHDGETGGVTLDGFTFSPEKWITLCLPFDATEEQAKAALGDNVDIEELNTSTWDEATQFLTLYFVPRTAIVAGMPYVVKVSATVNNPTFSGVTIKNVEPTTVYTTYCSTTGVYNATPLTVGDKSTLFIQNNRFYYPSVAGSLPATKCYFTLLGEAQQARGLGMHFWDDDDVASGIYSVTASTADQQSWYTPQGVRVSQPGKGLYIHGGKKVIVK